MPDGRDAMRHLEGLLGFALRRTQVAVSRSFVATFADLDVRQTQLGVLNVVEADPGLRPSRVGALLGIKRANIGPLLEGLERRGLLRREPSADDRRSQSLFLTAQGTALVAELHRREAAHEARIAAGLDTQERAQLLALLKRVEGAARVGEGEDGESAAA